MGSVFPSLLFYLLRCSGAQLGLTLLMDSVPLTFFCSYWSVAEEEVAISTNAETADKMQQNGTLRLKPKIKSQTNGPALTIILLCGFDICH